MIIFLDDKDLGVEDKELGKENTNAGGGEPSSNEPASDYFRINPEDGTERAANTSSNNMDCVKEHSERLTSSEAGESDQVSGDHDNDILAKTAGQTEETVQFT